MKRLLILSPCFILGILSCNKECDPEPPNNTPPPTTECKAELTKGLLAYYPFNGNANDATGNGNNGTPTNGAFFTTDHMGRSNRAAGFDGINDYIVVNDGGKLNADTITASVLVMVNSVDRRHSILGRWNFASANSVSWGVGQTLAQTNRWDFGVHNTVCETTYNYSAGDYLSHTETLQAGRWYHVLCSFANGVQKIYVDGELKITMTRNFVNLKKCPLSQLVIGAWWAKDIVSIDGKIDEVRIYNRVLSACEIKSLATGFGEN